MKVKVIREERNSSLVEWFEEGKIYRSIIPSSDVDVEGNCENPHQGLPHGDSFLPFITVDVSPEEIQFQLNNSGIWTLEELLKQPSIVQGAVNAAFGKVLANMLTRVMLLKGQ